MKILVINPNTTQAMTDDIARAARAVARGDTEIDCISPPVGPRSIESFTEEAISTVTTIEEIARCRDDYDAFVIACFGDGGLFAAREVARGPVIGVAEAAMLLACLVAHRFSIVTVAPRARPLLRDLVRRYGLEERCASVRSVPLTVLEIEEDWQRTEQLMIDEARRAIEQDDAEAICLGCAGMGALQERMHNALGVPILDGTTAAVKLAESLHDLCLMTAKVRAFQDLDPKEYVGTMVPAIQALSQVPVATTSRHADQQRTLE
jgi:allantoin racemase